MNTDDIPALVRELELRDRDVRALLPEPGRTARLRAESLALAARAGDLPLRGVLVGVKDLFRCEGLPTRAGFDATGPELDGPEAPAVGRLRRAGALVLGKTTTDQLAYSDPPATVNPHDASRTPGGSSAGSAAGVALGLFPAALGTQTTRSIVAPAAFCGVVGVKPSFGRIPVEGVVPLSPAMDTVGVLASSVDWAERLLSVLADTWRPVIATSPVLGVPTGDFMARLPEEGWRDPFLSAVSSLRSAGLALRDVAMGWDGALLPVLHAASHVLHLELARAHGELFDRHPTAFGPRVSEGIRFGRTLDPARLDEGRARGLALRGEIAAWMDEAGVDVLICPSQPGPAPALGTRTGWGDTTVPWSFAGLPCASLPAGCVDGLPVGLQVVARHGDDERLLASLRRIDDALRSDVRA